MNFPSGELGLTRDEAWRLAEHWVAAWNAHDLEAIMTHYDDAVELTSPVAAQLLGTSGGKVVGKASLRAYFQRGLEAYPNLHFQLADVLCGVNSRRALLHEPKGHAHGGVHGVVGGGEGGESCGELRWVRRRDVSGLTRKSGVPRPCRVLCDRAGILTSSE